MKKIFNKISIKTETVFEEDGRVVTSPTAHATDSKVTYKPGTAVQRGQMRTMEDGTTVFIPSTPTQTKRYDVLLSTGCSQIKKTKRGLIIETRFSTADPLVAEKLSEYYSLESKEVNAQIEKHIQDFDLE